MCENVGWSCDWVGWGGVWFKKDQFCLIKMVYTVLPTFNEASNINCQYSPPPSSELLKIVNLFLLGLV